VVTQELDLFVRCHPDVHHKVQLVELSAEAKVRQLPARRTVKRKDRKGRGIGRWGEEKCELVACVHKRGRREEEGELGTWNLESTTSYRRAG
jgi:hypothetical protein